MAPRGLVGAAQQPDESPSVSTSAVCRRSSSCVRVRACVAARAFLSGTRALCVFAAHLPPRFHSFCS